jgi:PAT family beta-lactamase induction signal transducer AmpG
MLIGGLLIQRFGIVRMIQYSLSAVATLVLAMSFSSPYWSNSNFVSLFIGLFCTLITLVTIGALALAMQLCWKRISAMQFTFCMTIFNFGLSSGAALFGYIRGYLGWQGIFIVFSLLAIIAMAVLKYIKTKNHAEHVERLETNYLDILNAESSLLVKSEIN